MKATSRQIQNFTSALHELTTNAVKYGPSKVDAGAQSVAARCERRQGMPPLLTLNWTESGVHVEPKEAARRGYGRELIENALSYALRARTEYVLGEDGVRCRIELPLA